MHHAGLNSFPGHELRGSVQRLFSLGISSLSASMSKHALIKLYSRFLHSMKVVVSINRNQAWDPSAKQTNPVKT